MELPSHLKRPKSLTDEMRGARTLRWRHVQERLAGLGVSPEDAAVGSLEDEDTYLEFGILVLRDGRTFAFEFDWVTAPGRDPDPDNAMLSEFDELDTRQRDFTYRIDIALGRQILEMD